jgi:hypothetical protein
MAHPNEWKYPSNSSFPDMPPDNEILPTDRIWRIKNIFGGINYLPYMMGLGQGNRAAPPSWIQLSAIMVTVFKQLNLGAIINDPVLDAPIHSMGALFVDNTNIYMAREHPGPRGALGTNADREQWSCLLNATGGALKPEKCWWYLLDYTCVNSK